MARKRVLSLQDLSEDYDEIQVEGSATPIKLRVRESLSVTEMAEIASLTDGAESVAAADMVEIYARQNAIFAFTDADRARLDSLPYAQQAELMNFLWQPEIETSESQTTT